MVIVLHAQLEAPHEYPRHGQSTIHIWKAPNAADVLLKYDAFWGIKRWGVHLSVITNYKSDSGRTGAVVISLIKYSKASPGSYDKNTWRQRTPVYSDTHTYHAPNRKVGTEIIRKVSTQQLVLSAARVPSRLCYGRMLHPQMSYYEHSCTPHVDILWRQPIPQLPRQHPLAMSRAVHSSNLPPSQLRESRATHMENCTAAPITAQTATLPAAPGRPEHARAALHSSHSLTHASQTASACR